MSRGFYPTGALVKVLRYYKDNADKETYDKARDELVNLLKNLVKFENFIKEVTKPPYPDSDPTSLLETLRARAEKILKAMEER